MNTTGLDDDAVEIVKKTFPYCYDDMLGFDVVGLDFVKLLSEQITNWKTMNRANAKMGQRINDLEGAIKKYCWHWDSYFSNKIVGNPPAIQDLKSLINENSEFAKFGEKNAIEFAEWLSKNNHSVWSYKQLYGQFIYEKENPRG